MLLIIIFIKCCTDNVNGFGLSSWKHLIRTAEGVANSFKNLGSAKNAYGWRTDYWERLTRAPGITAPLPRAANCKYTDQFHPRLCLRLPRGSWHPQQDSRTPAPRLIPQGGPACLLLASEGVEPWALDSLAKAQVSAHRATGQSVSPLWALWAGEPASYADAPVCHLSQTVLLSSLSPTVHSGHLWTGGRSTCSLACSATCSLILPASLHASWQITTLSNKVFFTWHPGISNL